jgi:hypothetical protein
MSAKMEKKRTSLFRPSTPTSLLLPRERARRRNARREGEERTTRRGEGKGAGERDTQANSELMKNVFLMEKRVHAFPQKKRAKERE